MRHGSRAAALVTVIGVLLVAACGGGASSPSQRPASAPAPPTAGAPAASAPPSSATAPAPLQKVVVSYSSVAGTYVPVWLAADAGLFAKQGLDVEMPYIASGTTSMQSLLAGDVQFIVTSGGEPIAAYLGGAPARLVFAWTQTISALFMVDPNITSPQQLRGKPVGITRFGGQPHTGARLALKTWGLDPETDVQYLQLGGVPEILAGMQLGAVVGGVFSPPTNVRAQQLGFRQLGDLAQMGVPYQGECLVALEPFVEAKVDLTKRVLRAVLEGVQLSLTDDATTLAVMGKYTRIEDPELLQGTLAHYRTVAKKSPYPTLEGLQTLLDLQAETDPRARTIQPREVVNTRALEQLEQEGVLREIFGG